VRRYAGSMGSTGRRILALSGAAALLTGCVSNGSAAPAATPEPTPVAEVRDAEATPEPEPQRVTLRRQHRTGDRYEVVTTFTLSDTPIHPDIGYTTWADATVTRDPSGALVARGLFTKSVLTHGDEVDPLGRDSDLSGVQVGLWLDETNRVTGEELSGQSAHNGDFARVVLDSLRAVRVYYPDGPIPVGTTWEGDPLRWDTRPAGWVVVNVRPVYTLERSSRGTGPRARGYAGRARRRWSPSRSRACRCPRAFPSTA